jgi:hypothetical protein
MEIVMETVMGLPTLMETVMGLPTLMETVMGLPTLIPVKTVMIMEMELAKIHCQRGKISRIFSRPRMWWLWAMINESNAVVARIHLSARYTI